ncbi:gluconokinase, GntK/IdnK-type [uncultured Algibacter sp.]|uniref:gluconokinase n=1 Tax=uncultured Algibacter sp. TaxID=298659 RepID=UPI00260A41CE|nr:gluconokinase, GntK/IdnK-type [uncultured Algibacter sp.]
MVIVVMGVSGSGKTTISKKLSERIEVPYFDADDFHPESNIDKMASGKALNDEDRRPWLEELAENISVWANEKGAVLACSALKESYRVLLSLKYKSIIWVYLSGHKALIKDRIEKRQGHFMSSDLLNAQFRDLEIPNKAVVINISKSPEDIINTIISKLKDE